MYLNKDGQLHSLINKELRATFKDIYGEPISLGSILVNGVGMEFEVKYGLHKMYCPVDEEYMNTIGVFCTCELFPMEAFPLGETHEWAEIKKEINLEND